MVRIFGQVVTIRATVPLGVPIPKYTFEERTAVDRFTHAKWQQLRIVPSDACTDEQFIRRASLDITGTLPTPRQVEDFVADQGKDKYDKLVDKLVDSDEYSYYFANKWADILRVKDAAISKAGPTARLRSTTGSVKPSPPTCRMTNSRGRLSRPSAMRRGRRRPSGTRTFRRPISTSIISRRCSSARACSVPSVTIILTKSGARTIIGAWLPTSPGSSSRKNLTIPGQQNQGRNQQQLLYTKTTGTVLNKRTKKAAAMSRRRRPDKGRSDVDPRQKLADWMVDAKNPFFARAVANRYWAHFFGKGIVDPLDDMRVTNPPSNPELLDALAKELVEHRYGLKHLIRAIAKSKTYHLSPAPNAYNQGRQTSPAIIRGGCPPRCCSTPSIR